MTTNEPNLDSLIARESESPMRSEMYYCHVEPKDPSELEEGYWFFSPSMGYQCAQATTIGDIFELHLDVEVANKPRPNDGIVFCCNVEECIEVVADYYDAKVITIEPSDLAAFMEQE
jgi:hypothetical protein